MPISQINHLPFILIAANREDDHILSCGCRITHLKNMDWRHSSSKLWYLARAQHQSRQQILPIKWWDTESTHEEQIPMPPLHQDKAIQTIPEATQKQSTWNVYQRCRPERNDVLGSNRHISVPVKQGYELHHECVPCQFKLHFLRANVQHNRIPNVENIREDYNVNEDYRIRN